MDFWRKECWNEQQRVKASFLCCAGKAVVCLRRITGVTQCSSGVTVITLPFFYYLVHVRCTWEGLRHVVPLASFQCSRILQTRICSGTIYKKFQSSQYVLGDTWCLSV